MKRTLVTLVMTVSLLGGLQTVLPRTVHAAVADGCAKNFLGLPVWYKYMDVGPATDKQGAVFVDANGNPTDPCAIIGPKKPSGDGIDWQAASGRIALAIVEILLRIGTLVSVGFVVYGGFRYITSQGEPDSTKSARQTIINSLIGLVITIIATGAVAFIANQLTT